MISDIENKFKKRFAKRSSRPESALEIRNEALTFVHEQCQLRQVRTTSY